MTVLNKQENKNTRHLYSSKIIEKCSKLHESYMLMIHKAKKKKNKTQEYVYKSF